MATLADKVTMSRLVLAPIAAACYLYLPTDYGIALWATAAVCVLSEITDWLDGRIARARKEVSDFGKLADPFCDVVFRMTLFMVMLLPVGLSGPVVAEAANPLFVAPVYAVDGDTGAYFAAGLVPFVPVFIQFVREIAAGALRAMTATTGLVLAARMSGKIKATVQGVTIIAILCGYALVPDQAWLRPASLVLVWVCAVLSIGSFIEYLWVNKQVLAKLLERKPIQ